MIEFGRMRLGKVIVDERELETDAVAEPRQPSLRRAQCAFFLVLGHGAFRCARASDEICRLDLLAKFRFRADLL
jgi:hypothetical protein